MEVILITKSAVGHKRRHYGAFATFILSGLVAAFVGGAFFFGTRYAPPPVIVKVPTASAAEFRQLRKQRKAIDNAIAEAEAGLDALSQRVGTLQAHVTRLNALGERIVTMILLDPDEFDFANPPGQGGPIATSDAASGGETVTVQELTASLRTLAEELSDREVKLRAVETTLMERFLDARVYPTGRPVREGWISSLFGQRRDPISGRRAKHEGMDFAGAKGSDVMAVAAGVVTHAGPRQGYGNMVELAHGDGYVTRYAHNSENLVQVGETVRRGETVALMGSTGRSTGAHVHFEVHKDGQPVDPRPFVRAAE